MIEITVVERESDLVGMEAEWDELVVASQEDNPFRRWLWNWTWWEHYRQGRRLAVLAARQGGQLLGLVPAFLEREPWRPAGRSLRLLGSTDNICSEYLGPILRRDSAAAAGRALLDFLLRQWSGAWDFLRWTDLPADGVELPLIEAYLAERRMPFARLPGYHNILVHFPGTWDEYLANLSYGRRKKTRQQIRKAEQAGAEFAVADDPRQFPRLWDELRRLHNRHWQNVGQPGLFTNPRFDAFHTQVAEAYCRRGELLLAVLRLEGQAIAASYAIRQGQTVYEYQRGLDPAGEHLHPGYALQFQMFRHAIAGGVCTWDYLRGDHRNKRELATGERETLGLLIPAPGAVARQRFRLEQWLRAGRRRLGRLRDAARRRHPAPAASEAPAEALSPPAAAGTF